MKSQTPIQGNLARSPTTEQRQIRRLTGVFFSTKGKTDMKTSMLLTAFSAALFAAAVTAAPPKFDKADTNGDGHVDATEFAASGVKKELAKLDKDGDGKLTKKEYSAALDEDCE